MRATMDDLKSLRLASPISAFTFWHFELVGIAENEGIPHPLYGDIEPMFKAGLTPRAAVTKLAKRYAPSFRLVGKAA